jgi:hypothetical protein
MLLGAFVDVEMRAFSAILPIPLIGRVLPDIALATLFVGTRRAALAVRPPIDGGRLRVPGAFRASTVLRGRWGLARHPVLRQLPKQN